MDYLNLLGLVANLTGAILLSFSFVVEDPIKNFGTGFKIGGKSLTHTSIDKKRFRGGIIILSLGFILQLISLFVNANQNV